MKTKLKNLIAGVAVFALTAEAQAVVSLSLEPVIQSIGVGAPASVDIVVSGLGDFASPSLGGFFIDLNYNAAVVSASSLTFGSMLDLGTFGSDRKSDLSVAGLVHLDEVSFETADDLNKAQPESFTLATLGFIGLAPGASPLVFGSVSLSDEAGNTIEEFAINTGLIEVAGTGVPDSGPTALLLGGTIAGLWQLRKRVALAGV
jgi:hypothetical protein